MLFVKPGGPSPAYLRGIETFFRLLPAHAVKSSPAYLRGIETVASSHSGFSRRMSPAYLRGIETLPVSLLTGG